LKKIGFKRNKNLIKRSMVILLIAILALAGMPGKVQSQGSYDTNFSWTTDEEVLNEWPLDATIQSTSYTGIGTAGFSYHHYYYDEQDRIVLEFELSCFRHQRVERFQHPDFSERIGKMHIFS